VRISLTEEECVALIRILERHRSGGQKELCAPLPSIVAKLRKASAPKAASEGTLARLRTRP
jgi:hypothetical protein